MDIAGIRAALGADADTLLGPLARAGYPPHLPGPAWVDAVWGAQDAAGCTPAWRRNLQALFDAGRLAGSGYLCLLRVTGGAPEVWGDIALDGGCSGLEVPLGTLDIVAARHAHHLPLVVEVPPSADAATLHHVRDQGAVALRLAAAPPERHIWDAVFAAAAAAGLPVIVGSAGAEVARLGVSLVALDPSTDAAEGPDAAARSAAVYTRFSAALSATVLAAAPTHVLGTCTVAAIGGGELQRALRIAVLHKRAGGAGVRVVLASEVPDAARIALLHAVQDVWACDEIGLG